MFREIKDFDKQTATNVHGLLIPTKSMFVFGGHQPTQKTKQCMKKMHTNYVI
jgi:hypothetical protein